ncbi:MAG: hypothetical protein JST84_19765, partial [Acidobacteria bacterium]|nr:hypothetical protein [Acidobacteriota bacterium]
MKRRTLLLWFLLTMLCTSALALDPDFDKKVKHDFADSNGVKIHYAALGKSTAPLIVMIHG